MNPKQPPFPYLTFFGHKSEAFPYEKLNTSLGEEHVFGDRPMRTASNARFRRRTERVSKATAKDGTIPTLPLCRTKERRIFSFRLSSPIIFKNGVTPQKKGMCYNDQLSKIH